MRRYLYNYEEENSTSLPGFPGDFTAGWQTYVNVIHSGDPSTPEHEVMAAHYRNIIVDALQQYDNYDLAKEEYEALAWHGLSNTEIYENLSSAEKQAIVDNRETALNKTTDSCN